MGHIVQSRVAKERIWLELYLNMGYEGSNSSFLIMQELGSAITIPKRILRTVILANLALFS